MKKIRTNHRTKDTVDAVIKMKVERHMSRYSIRNILMTEYGYKDAMSYEIISRAEQQIADLQKDYIKNAYELQISSLEAQLEIAKRDKDKKLILEITKELNKLLGLYTDKVQLDGKINHSVDIINIIYEKPKDDETLN